MPRRPAIASIAAVALAIAVLSIGACGRGGGPSGSEAHTSATAPSRYEGGERSIEGFGFEARGPERAALIGAFRRYFDALAADDYATTCSYLATAVQRSLERIAAGSSKTRDCGASLPRLLSSRAGETARAQGRGRVAKVRVEGDRAFLIFHAPGARLYQLTMVRERNRWKATTLSASILVPSPATLGR